MKMRDFLKDSSGSIAVSTIILMVVFVGLMAIVIDLGHVFTVQSELRNAADACALRGARAFLPDNIPITEVYADAPDDVRAKQEAYNTIKVNQSDNTKLELEDNLALADIQVGIWDYDARNWVPGTLGATLPWPPDPSLWGKYIGPGVTLPTKRTGTTATLGAVGMTLAQVFGISTVPVSTMATAALSGVGELEEATPGSFPIAVDEDKVHAAGDIIFMSPDTPDVGGWTSLSPDTASASVFKGLIDGSIPNPEVSTGDTISLQNGTACTAIKEAIKSYTVVEESKGVYKLTPPVEVKFPVVQVDTFNQKAEVKGFMAATIEYFRDSNAPKDILIPNSDPPKYTGDCMLILKAAEGSSGNLPGGGAWYGLLSTQPKLVQ
jgi:Flp pilus assembly protein TadG